MEEKKDVRKPHAVMVALPYQGHLNPFIHLAIKLASKGFAITFVNFEYIHQLILNSKSHHQKEFNIFFEACKSGLDIRYATISDGFPLEYDREANFVEFWEYLFSSNGFPSRVDEFMGNLSSLSDPSLVPFLVADTIASWPGFIAHKYSMLNVSFWTGPALVFAINSYMDLLAKNGHYPRLDINLDPWINYIPGVEPMRTTDLMSYLQETDTTTIIHKLIYRVFEEVKKADFVLHNTVQELESHTLSALNQINATYAIGPVNCSHDSTQVIVSKSFLSETDCTEWLNSRPTRSVLYVSFGSDAQVKREVIEEILKGLILSKVNFIWVIRPGAVKNETYVLPIGFEDQVKDRGLIVPWCNQNAVLSHPAIGGFLTHCGWNSVLESIWFGVPMICYPVLYDQPTNRKLVVDDWKIGINLCNGTSMNGEQVSLKIKWMMCGETSDDVRKQIKKFESMLHDALGENGSSERNFDRFLKDLECKIMHRK